MMVCKTWEGRNEGETPGMFCTEIVAGNINKVF